MKKNTLFILIAIIIAVIIVLMQSPREGADQSVTSTATPANGLVTGDEANQAQPEDMAPPAEGTDNAGAGNAEVDGVPAGTDVTTDNATDTQEGTTPAPENMATPPAQQ